MAEHTAHARGDLDVEIERLEFDYLAEFVPQNVSRHRDEKEPTLNWKITLRRRAVHGVVFMCDYMQGIGSVPGWPMGLSMRNRSVDEDNMLKLFKRAAIDGKYPHRYHVNAAFYTMRELPKPELRDILYSLVADSDVLETSGFEDWASNLGYDTDSRKAEATYRDCIDYALRFKALVGQENLDKLRDLFQGY